MWQNTLTKQREKRNRRNTAQFKYFKYEPRPSIMGFAYTQDIVPNILYCLLATHKNLSKVCSVTLLSLEQ